MHRGLGCAVACVGEREIATSELFEDARAGNRRALARLFTALERSPESLREITRLAHQHTGRADVIGITGPPGAGKSTIVDGLIQHARAAGRSVGVLAVDPTSPFTGGAVLGDRIRMQAHHADPGVFIRSFATRGVGGGLNAVTAAGVRLLDAIGKDLVLVETIGVGQSELDVMGVADLVIVVLVPEAGDTVQTMKAGLLEIADLFVVNKADRDGAGQLASAVRSMIALDRRPVEERQQVLLTQARTGDGVYELYDRSNSLIDALRSTGELTKRRSAMIRRQFDQLLTTTVRRAIDRLLDEPGPNSDVVRDIESGRLDAHTAFEVVAARGLLTDVLSPRHLTNERVMGIDLSGSEARPTACAVLAADGVLSSLTKKSSDEAIVDLVREYRPSVVAVDSPLGFPQGMDCLEESHDCRSVHNFHGRICERELMNAGVPLYVTTKRSIIKQMVYRAIALAGRIRDLGCEVIEVYPYAAKVSLFGARPPKKTSPEGLAYLTGGLSALVPGLPNFDAQLDHDLLDALTAAYTARLYTQGRTRALGIEEEAQIHVPDLPGRAL